MSRCALVCKKIEYLFLNISFYFCHMELGLQKHWIFMNIFPFPSCSGIQSSSFEYIRWGGRLHVAMILSDASSMKIWWRISFLRERNYLKKKRSEKAFNSPFYRINSGLDFRPLCQDSHRNHHRGLWKRSRMNRKSNEPVLQHTSCYNICFMLCISIFSWTFIWR